jgi:aminoglycoside/choline kinase family phosphotransferase
VVLTNDTVFPKGQAEALIMAETGLAGPFRWQALHGDGSERSFYRVNSAPNSLVVVWSPLDDESFPNENDSYVYMGRHLNSKGVPVPKIYAYGRSEGLILIEDLGSIHLQDAVRAAKGELEKLYRQATDVLIHLQVHAGEDLDTSHCFESSLYDQPFVIERELKYFHERFLVQALDLDVSWDQLEPEFSLLAARAAGKGRALVFLHRDFQSRNLMLRDKTIHLIDFQGARLGPPQYDLAALLLDPYVELPQSLQERLLTEHVRQLSELAGISAEEFLEGYPHVALCRSLQILAAFAFLTRVKRRSHFAQYIVPAWQQLRRQLAQPACAGYQVLADLVQFQEDEYVAEVAARLERKGEHGRKKY